MAAIRNTKGLNMRLTRFSNEPKREPSLSSRAKAANYATEWNIFPNGINDQNALSHRNFRLHCRAALFVLSGYASEEVGQSAALQKGNRRGRTRSEQMSSGLPLKAETFVQCSRHVSNVPTSDTKRNHVCQERSSADSVCPSTGLGWL
jgi:hypothetical protein